MPTGEHYYKKSLVLLANYEKLCEESSKIAPADDFKLKIKK